MKFNFSTFITKLTESLVLLTLPSFALALDTGSIAPGTFQDVVKYILEITGILIPILFSLAFVVFFWGLSKFILNSSGNAAEIQKGKDYMLWGILALFVLVSARALLSIVASDLGLGTARIIPFLPGGSSVTP